MKNKVLGIYCRISRLKEEGKDRSIADQKALGIEKAKELGYDYELYVDEGLSAAGDDIEFRPQFKRLLGDMESGELYAIYGIDQSRFERNPQIHHIFVNTVKKNISEYYTDLDGLINLNDPSTELMANMVSVFNQYHVTVTKHKVKSVLKRNAQEGKGHGILPYGYTTDDRGYIVVDDAESKIVEKIYNLSLERVGVQSIANLLNAENVPTRYNTIGKGTITTTNKYTGKSVVREKKDVKWVGNTVRGILINTIYKGERVFSNEIYSVESIIPKSKWERVKINLSKNKHSGKKKYDYLLKGKLRCGKCGRNYYGRSRSDKKDHTYICSSRRVKGGNCGNRGLNIDKIEDFIWFRIINSSLFLKVLKRDFSFDKNNLAEIENSISVKQNILATLTKSRARIIDTRAKGIITDDELSEQLTGLTIKTNDIKNEIDVLKYKSKEMIDGGSILSNYQRFQRKLDLFKDRLSFNEKAMIVEAFIEDIIVDFDEVEKVYKLDISMSVTPSDFDDDYPDNYGNIDKTFMSLRNEFKGQNTTGDRATLDMVWWGFLNGLFDTNPPFPVTFPATG